MRIEWFFIWTNLNHHHTRIFCDKFGWNWPSCSGECFFLNFINVFSLFHNYLPLEKGWALLLNKLESCSPKDVLCHVWLKLAQCFRKRSFFYFVNVFLFLCNFLPWKRAGPFIWTNLNPLHPLCQVWLKFIVPTKLAKSRPPWLLLAMSHIFNIMATSALKFSR